jgi:hypothetical protein
LHKFLTGWLFLVCVLLCVGACGDEDPLENSEVEPEASPPPLPVREWYPTPKHSTPRRVYVPVPSSPPPRQQPAYSAATRQQQRGMTPPAYTNQQAAPQPQWGGGAATQWQSPVRQQPQQYQFVYPYQFEQRPWGAPGVANQSQSTTGQGSWPQNGSSQWGMPAYDGHSGWGTDPYNGYPGSGIPGYTR